MDGGQLLLNQPPDLLPHRDREVAKRLADEHAAKISAGFDSVRSARPRAARVLGLYLKHRTPDKGEWSR
jgi:hypothetical protein